MKSSEKDWHDYSDVLLRRDFTERMMVVGVKPNE